MHHGRKIKSLSHVLELLGGFFSVPFVLRRGCWPRFLSGNLILAGVFISLCSAFCECSVSQTFEPTILVKLSDGKSIKSNRLDIENGVVSFAEASSGEDFPRVLPFEQISKLQFRDSGGTLPTPNFTVALGDGSRISAEQLFIRNSEANIQLADQFSIEIPQRQIRWIKLKADSVGFDDAQWKRVLKDNSRTSDAIIVLRNGELEAIEGIVGELQDGRVGFSIGSQTANVELAKIAGIVFYQAAANEQQLAVCQVQLLDGSKLFAKDIFLSRTRLMLKTVSGIDVDLPASSLSFVDFSMGRAVYLDDLQPATNDWKPLLASVATVPALRQLNLAKANRSYSGKPLTLLIPIDDFSIASQSRQFEHGFAMRAGGRLSFNLDDEFATLSGNVGFDPDANLNGNALLTVRADGKLVLQEQLENKSMTTPLRLDLDIAGASRIVFRLEYHDGRSVGDQIHLVDLKVSK